MAAALTAAAVILAVSGGFRTTVGGFRISARSPVPVAFLALTLGFSWYRQARRAQSVARDLDAIWSAIERRSSRIIVATALISGLTAAVYSTRSAAGADASGYLSEAATLARGQLFHHDELFELTRGHDAYLTSPLGWRPGPTAATQSPTYPIGLPMLMAVPHAIAGLNGAVAMVIVSAVVAVIATGLIAMSLGGSSAGVLAASLIAFTPIFLYQSIQPMSDVPVTAAWMLCFALVMRNRPLSSGIACAIAVMIRPNLAPLAIVPLIVAHRRIRFAIPVALAGAIIAVSQWVWYGSPLRSGYGSAEELFALANIGGNVTRYATWFITTAPVFALAVVGVVGMRANRTVQLLSAFAALVVAAYLVYAVFDDWSYLRFLLPAMAICAVLAAIAMAAWIERCPPHVRGAVLFAVIVGITAHALWAARSRDTFRLADDLRRVSQVGEYVNAHAPGNAVLIAGEQSGSMRYYTHRSIVRWEAATPEAMSDALAALQRQSRPVYVVLDAWEDEPFRKKTGGVVGLDWPPAVEAGTARRTRVWSLADRDRFHGGGRIDTLRLP